VGNYAVEYRLERLVDVARHTKSMPDSFINEAGNHITDEFRKYAEPLLGTDFPQPYRVNGAEGGEDIKITTRTLLDQ